MFQDVPTMPTRFEMDDDDDDDDDDDIAAEDEDDVGDGDRDYEAGLVFIIMSFAPSMDQVYGCIKDECELLKLRAHRVDENVTSALILHEITESIKRCEFIICDLSDQKPNVYYELGYAHGFGNQPREIFLVARSDTTLAFDLAAYRVHFYSSTEDLRTLIRTRFSRMVRERRGSDDAMKKRLR